MSALAMVVFSFLVYSLYLWEIWSLPWQARQWSVILLAVNLPVFALVAYGELKGMAGRVRWAVRLPEDWRMPASMLGAALALVWLAPRIGFTYATALVLPTTMLLMGARRLLAVAVVSLSVLVFLRVIIAGILQVPLDV